MAVNITRPPSKPPTMPPIKAPLLFPCELVGCSVSVDELSLVGVDAVELVVVVDAGGKPSTERSTQVDAGHTPHSFMVPSVQT